MAWRDTSLTPKLLGVDYTACAPLMLYAVDISWRNLYIAITVVGFLTFIKIWHITPMGFLRILRSFIHGRYRSTPDDYIVFRRRTRW